MGIRPLVIGKLNNSYIFASETCALDIVDAKFIREVENGEMIVIENNEMKSLNLLTNKNKDHVCLNIFILLDQIV